MGGKSSTITNTAPRIAGLQLQTSAYGRVIPIIYGTQRIAANIFWYDDFVATPHTETQTSGGKGGGGVTSSNTTYTYTASLMFGLCEGQINSVNNIWSDKELKTLADLGFTFFNGSYGQNVWGFLTSNHPDKAINYRGQAYLANALFSLGDNASLPNLTYEVKGLKLYNSTDANPKEVIYDFLTNVNYGAGFPASKIGDLTQYNNYCLANNLLMSPMFDEQKAANEHIEDFLKATNSAFIWSEGVLKIVPYGDSVSTANGVTFTPNTTPVYDLTDDDYIDIDEPIKVTRSTNADAYNHIKIEFLNRSNAYNAEIAESKDLANIDLYGLRPSDAIQIHSVCDSATAKKISQIMLQRTLYVRNKYDLKVSWKYCLLEPMDLITLTDSKLGFDKLTVRVTEIKEDDEGILSITAEEWPFGIASATLYPNEQAQGTAIDYNIPSGNINLPFIFEPPLLLSNNYEIWFGLSGGTSWGGADIWASYDGSSYAFLTSISQPARTGYLSANWTTGNVINVDLTESRGVLQTSSGALAIIGEEIIKYSIATLTGSFQYLLEIIERGLYGTMEVEHSINERFARLDNNLIKQQYTQDMVGKTIFYKAISYNIYGVVKQSLEDVDPFFYKIKGTADQSPLADVTNFVSYYKDGVQVLQWSAVTDQFRAPIDYEIRRGNTWGGSQILGRTSSNNFIADLNGRYLIKAHYLTTKGVHVYSENEISLEIEGATIVKNVVATWDEKATGWTGIFSGGAIIQNNNLVLGSSIVLSDVEDVAKIVNFGLLDSVSASGSYEIPDDHIIELKAVGACRLSLNYSVYGKNIVDIFSQIPLVSEWPNIVGNNSDYYAVFPKIALSQDGINWGDWQDFYIADYVAKAYKCKLDIYSFSKTTQPVIEALSFTVDVPDRIEKGTGVSVGTGGLSIVYTIPFQVKPNTQITILNAQQGDDAVVTSDTANGFTISVKNAGVNVTRLINWISQGY